MPAEPNLKTALRFLAELRENNDKPWFDAHRPVYEATRDAFAQFVDRLIDARRSADQLGGLSAKQCVARIYRDVRFSPDKSPYKSNLAAVIAPGGWKGTGHGFYLSLAPGGLTMVGGGLYQPTAAQLQRFREAIDQDAAAFRKVTRTKSFVETFGAVDGERLKTAPKGFERTHPEIELLRFKSVTAIRKFSDRDVAAADFQEKVLAACQALKPFLMYLQDIGV